MRAFRVSPIAWDILRRASHELRENVEQSHFELFWQEPESLQVKCKA